ncbi:MAG: hypothetical protein KAX33_12465 [Candidatus Lokiarchaeota archaeon]|nr:hypothetical protein [Candidatus Lokiarchaeota archaeon]
MTLNMFRSIHGPHCLLRAFKTVCPKCKNDVFYWECSHGSKVFFEYPIYGRLIRHKCKKHSTKENSKKKNHIKVKIPLFIIKDNFSCPICGKIFSKKNQLVDHIKQLKKSDEAHHNFYNNKLNLKTDSEILNYDLNKNLSKNENKNHYRPTFGKITIVNKKSSK